MDAVELSAFDRSTTRLNSERRVRWNGIANTDLLFGEKRKEEERLTSRDFFYSCAGPRRASEGLASTGSL